MKTYNGHRSWNAWNISLWISNDEQTYRFALECLARAKSNLTKATRYFMEHFRGERTPDGGVYNALSVRLCLEGFLE